MKKLLFLLPFLFVVSVAGAQTPTATPLPFVTPTAAPTATFIAPSFTPTPVPTPLGGSYTYSTTNDNTREYKMQQLVPYFNANGQNFAGNQTYLNYRTEITIDQDFNAYIFAPLQSSILSKINLMSYQQLLQTCPLIAGVLTTVNGVTKCQ